MNRTTANKLIIFMKQLKMPKNTSNYDLNAYLPAYHHADADENYFLIYFINKTGFLCWSIDTTKYIK